MAILHIVQYALPEVTSGYTIRTAAVLREQKRLGLDPVVLTSPRQPGGNECEIGGVIHYRSGPEAATRSVWLRDRARVHSLARRIEELAAQRGDIRCLHAHSPVLCGLAALRAGRALRLPVVYEVRGLWEEAMLAGGRWRRWSPRYRLARMMETMVCRRAAKVVAISNGLKQEFAGRGVPEERICVVPNGVDAGSFQVTQREPGWRASHGLGSGPVILYLGALRDYEGVDLLLDAFASLREQVPNLQLVVVGDGEARERLTQRAASRPGASLLGPAPHAEVGVFYAEADMVVYPRRATRATELVTPLKPLEAMAAGKAIIASDVGGLRELLTDGETARLFAAGSVEALARACLDLLASPGLRASLGENARRVASERYDWSIVCQRYLAVYQQLV